MWDLTNLIEENWTFEQLVKCIWHFWCFKVTITVLKKSEVIGLIRYTCFPRNFFGFQVRALELLNVPGRAAGIICILAMNFGSEFGRNDLWWRGIRTILKQNHTRSATATVQVSFLVVFILFGVWRHQKVPRIKDDDTKDPSLNPKFEIFVN